MARRRVEEGASQSVHCEGRDCTDALDAPWLHRVRTMQTRTSTPPPSLARPDAATLRRLAVAHDVDPRSIVRELREPGSVRGMAGARARAAASELRREEL